MTAGVAISGWSALRVGTYMPGVGATGAVPEADRLFPVVRDALAMAGLTPKDIGAALFAANPPSTQQLGLAVHMSARLGLRCRATLAEVGIMGITGGLAFDMAADAIRLGRCDHALALGLCYQANERVPVAMERGNRVVGDVDFQSIYGLTPVSWYGLDAARYLHETGQTRAELAAIAIKSREFACHNPIAQFREPLSLEHVLEADMIVDPLGRLDVPAQADGAICLVLSREDLMRENSEPYVRLAARGFAHDGYHQMGEQPHDMTDFVAARNAVGDCLQEAETNLDNVDFFELYAPCTITEALVAEAIGLFGRGEGCKAAQQGISSLGGTRPVNTSGGCLSRGHPPSLSGLYGLLECAEQLSHQAGHRQVENARRGLNTCEGGNYNIALAHLLERVES